MSINTDVTVIVVTYNSAHCIARLAEGLQHHDSIIFVDNASADDTVVQINQHLPHAIVIAQKRNLGFGAATNRRGAVLIAREGIGNVFQYHDRTRSHGSAGQMPHKAFDVI